MKEYMESLGLDGEVVEAVMARHGAVVEALEQRLRSQAVDSAVKQAVTAAGGRNLTAIRALLDETGFGDDPEADAVAAVAADGTVTFVGAGSATITVTAAADGDWAATTTSYTVTAGDAVLTGNGESHSIENVGEDTLSLLAVVITYPNN